MLVNATCVCLSGYVEGKDGSCITKKRRLVYVKKLKFGVPFLFIYRNFFSTVTKAFKARMEASLHRALSLSSNDYVLIQKFHNGSLLVDFVVVLNANSTDNRTTIDFNMRDEIGRNTTGSLHEYLPFNQTMNVQGTIGSII